MPKTFRKKVRKDKKQDKRIKSLEKFVYKTIENKQINNYQISSNVDNSWLSVAGLFYLDQGTSDGALSGDSARVGNSVTLMKQAYKINLKLSQGVGQDQYNQIRIIMVESPEASTTLAPRDILAYWQYATHGDLVFCSPYTTKATFNHKYKIHFDKVFTLTQDTSPCRTLNHTVKFRENGSPGKVVAFDDNNVYPSNHRITLLAISDSGALLHPSLSVAMRATYKDA